MYDALNLRHSDMVGSSGNCYPHGARKGMHAAMAILMVLNAGFDGMTWERKKHD